MLPPVTLPVTLASPVTDKVVKRPNVVKLELITLAANVLPVKLLASTLLAVTLVKPAPLPTNTLPYTLPAALA